MSHISRSAEQAAQAILALINSSPRTPTQEAIAAIIANVAPSTPVLGDHAASERTEELKAAIAVVEAAEEAYEVTDESDDLDELYRSFEARCEAIWAIPPRTLADLQLRAMIAKHRGDPWVKPSDCDAFTDQAVAELIDAVLRFGEQAAKTDDVGVEMLG
jgi:hypothetical protein